MLRILKAENGYLIRDEKTAYTDPAVYGKWWVAESVDSLLKVLKEVIENDLLQS